MFGDDISNFLQGPEWGSSRRGIQDGYGTDLATFKNFSPDVTALDEEGPTLEEAYIDGRKLYLGFDEILRQERSRAHASS